MWTAAHGSPRSRPPRAISSVVRRVVTAVAGDKGGGRRPFSVGVSRVAHSLEELPDAYAHARRAVEVGRRVHGGGSTTFFDQLGLHRLIALIPDGSDELGSFVQDVLGPLADDLPVLLGEAPGHDDLAADPLGLP